MNHSLCPRYEDCKIFLFLFFSQKYLLFHSYGTKFVTLYKFNSDNCNTSIVNFHRSCPNPDCSYDLCLTCCSELREVCQPRGGEAEYSHQQFCEGAYGQGTVSNGSHIPANGNRYVSQSHMAIPVNRCTDHMSSDFPDWIAEADGRIPCPPKARGGCGTKLLELRRIFEANWVEKLISSSEYLTINYQSPDIDFSLECSLCHPISSAGSGVKASEVRQAAYRENCHDNSLYCPNAVHLGDNDIEHFQFHWMRGEPVVVRNVREKASGLSWEPMVMWRAFIGAKKVLKEEAVRVKAIDCLDWCEVCGNFQLVELDFAFYSFLSYLIRSLFLYPFAQC